MQPQILNGKIVAEMIKSKVKNSVALINRKLKLVIIQIGNNPASIIYIKNKIEFCNEVGIDCEVLKYTEDNSKEDIISKIKDLNMDENITAILVQLPLPRILKSNTQEILDTIASEKDVDGLNYVNKGKLFTGSRSIIPATPLAVMEILKHYSISLKGKSVVIIGRSYLVGKPLSMLFLDQDCTVTICHSQTEDLKKHTLQADILISSVGKPALIKKDMIIPGTVLVDIGINRQGNKIVGDISSDAYELSSFYTPVPGGVGPVTVACLGENIINCAEMLP